MIMEMKMKTYMVLSGNGFAGRVEYYKAFNETEAKMAYNYYTNSKARIAKEVEGKYYRVSFLSAPGVNRYLKADNRKEAKKIVKHYLRANKIKDKIMVLGEV